MDFSSFRRSMMIIHETENYHGWECMPASLLELIMGRLRFVDRLRFAAVCKWWKKAFEDSPSKQLPYGQPLLLVTKTFEADEKILFDPWTKKEILLQDEDFRNTIHLRSREGWILLATVKTVHSFPFILYNPFTKRKLKLPKFVHGPISFLSGDILMHNGFPDRVVLTRNMGGCCVTLFICRPEDEAWEAHTYFCKEDRWLDLGDVLFVIEQNVYVVDVYGCIIGFDLIQSKWTDLLGDDDLYSYMRPYKNYVACDGEIFQVWPRYDIERKISVDSSQFWRYEKSVTEFVFRRFNFSRSAWEELEEKELRGKCWCLADWKARDSGLSYVTVGIQKVHCLNLEWDSYSLKDYHLTAPENTVQNVFQEDHWAQASWVHI